jgi:hypothetical protein
MTTIRTFALLGVLLAGCGQGARSSVNTGSGGSGEGSGGKTTTGGKTGTGGASTGGATGDTGGSDATGGKPGDAGPVSCSPVDAGTPTGDVTAPGTAAKARPFLKPRAKDTAAPGWIDRFSEAQWLALVPRQSPRSPDWGSCHPVGSTDYKWDPLDPDHLTYVDAAGATVMVLPNATDGHTTVPVTVLSGKTVQVPIWTVNGATCYAQETIDYEKSQYLFNRLEELAAAYDSAATRKDVYARRIALALDAWADYVPDYFLTNQNNGKPLDVAEAEAKNYTVVQRMSDHNGVGHELDSGPVYALDAIYDSQALKDLSTERKYDVRQKIIDGFFVNHVDYLLKKIPLATHVATNLSGTPEQLANLAIVLGRADWIDWLDRYMQLTVVHLLRDGMDGESFSYCYGYLNANRVTTVEMAGYFNVWPPVNDAQRAVQSAADEYNDLIQKGLDAITSVLEPDGTVPPFGNTNFNGNGKARTQSRSTLLPAYGHLTLADGSGANQTQVNLNFVDNANHDEQDLLTFTLFGAGSELLSDLRYSRMPGRPFTESTMAHNTVAIDRKDQFRSTNQDTGNKGHLFTGGDLVLYEPNLAGISVAEVNGARAYNAVAERYQRLQILNTIDPAQPYLIDLFRAKGGGTHDYFIHGATRFDSTAPPPEKTTPAGASTLPLALIDKPYPLLEGTETFVEPPQDSEPWYGAFRDVWTARSNGNWSVTFKATAGMQGSRITMVDDGDVDVYVGKSPAPFRDKMPAETPQAFYGYWRPSLMVRHRAAAVDSLFVSVIEPFSGAPAVTAVERLPLATKDKDHVALRIKLKSGREDVVLVDLASPAVTGQPSPGRFATADGKYALTGRVGVAPSQGKAALVAGTKFEHDGKTLAADQAAFTGGVSDVLRARGGCSSDAFVTDAALPEGDVLKGRWIVLTFATYKVIPSGTSFPMGVQEQKGIRQPFLIDHVQRTGGQTYVVLAADPMLTMSGGKVTETTRPGRTFEGPVTFEIPMARSE